MLSEMDMEELVSCNNNDATNIAKGKRTNLKRRLRPLSPCDVVTATATTSVVAITTAVVASSCSSASGGGGGGSFSSTTFEEEEEDMANCLILLAQGKVGEYPPHHHHKDLCGAEKGSTKVDFYVYECKTCNRTFPSFQALGGHRASHKKPKVEEKKSSSPSPSPPPRSLPPPPPRPASSPLFHFEEAKQSHMKIINPSVSLQLGCGNNNKVGLNFHGNKSKIHECSICGSEFTSGQALGGHMRRHRASNNNNNIVQTTTAISDIGAVDVKPRNVLELDLNLPAPEDDLRDSKFQFPANQNSMMLSAAPALVGCHY